MRLILMKVWQSILLSDVDAPRHETLLLSTTGPGSYSFHMRNPHANIKTDTLLLKLYRVTTKRDLQPCAAIGRGAKEVQGRSRCG